MWCKSIRLKIFFCSLFHSVGPSLLSLDSATIPRVDYMQISKLQAWTCLTCVQIFKNSLYRPVSSCFCWNRSVTFPPKASSSSHSYQGFRVILAHNKISACHIRPIAISAYKFNVNPDFNFVYYWKYMKLIKIIQMGLKKLPSSLVQPR